MSDPLTIVTKPTPIPARQPQPGHGPVNADTIMFREIQIAWQNPNLPKTGRVVIGKYGTDAEGAKVMDGRAKTVTIADLDAAADMTSDKAKALVGQTIATMSDPSVTTAQKISVAYAALVLALKAYCLDQGAIELPEPTPPPPA